VKWSVPPSERPEDPVHSSCRRTSTGGICQQDKAPWQWRERVLFQDRRSGRHLINLEFHALASDMPQIVLEHAPDLAGSVIGGIMPLNLTKPTKSPGAVKKKSIRTNMRPSVELHDAAMNPQELQNLLDELEASRSPRKRAWDNLQEIRWVLKDAARIADTVCAWRRVKALAAKRRGLEVLQRNIIN
jgi:hypothetical protein